MTRLQVERFTRQGATVLVAEDHSLPVVRFTLALRPGTIADPVGQSGLTAVVLDLSLRGTAAHSRESFNRALEEMGSSITALAAPSSRFGVASA